jgi:hypothetical protein
MPQEILTHNPAVERSHIAGGFLRDLQSQTLEWRIHWLLRIGVFLEFLGHGACGVNTKAGWLPYFHVFAIPDAMAWKIMPWIGTVDICLGIIALLSPFRALLLYMGISGAFTALLRPAAGEGPWEFVERSYNYGIPFAFLCFHSLGADRKSWFARLRHIPVLSRAQAQSLLWVFRVVIALMLVGHGALGSFTAKAGLLKLYRGAGFGSLGIPLEMFRAGIGFFEMGLGIAALLARRPAFFLFIFAWKLSSEMLYPVAGAHLACWEVVERGCSYVAPLAALCAITLLARSDHKTGDR